MNLSRTCSSCEFRKRIRGKDICWLDDCEIKDAKDTICSLWKEKEK